MMRMSRDKEINYTAQAPSSPVADMFCNRIKSEPPKPSGHSSTDPACTKKRIDNKM